MWIITGYLKISLSTIYRTKDFTNVDYKEIDILKMRYFNSIISKIYRFDIKNDIRYLIQIVISECLENFKIKRLKHSCVDYLNFLLDKCKNVTMYIVVHSQISLRA